jgi:hypothetical protein
MERRKSGFLPERDQERRFTAFGYYLSIAEPENNMRERKPVFCNIMTMNNREEF